MLIFFRMRHLLLEVFVLWFWMLWITIELWGREINWQIISSDCKVHLLALHLIHNIYSHVKPLAHEWSTIWDGSSWRIINYAFGKEGFSCIRILARICLCIVCEGVLLERSSQKKSLYAESFWNGLASWKLDSYFFSRGNFTSSSIHVKTLIFHDHDQHIGTCFFHVCKGNVCTSRCYLSLQFSI